LVRFADIHARRDMLLVHLSACLEQEAFAVRPSVHPYSSGSDSHKYWQTAGSHKYSCPASQPGNSILSCCY
jgi:hypothetical protein